MSNIGALEIYHDRTIKQEDLKEYVGYYFVHLNHNFVGKHFFA